MSESPWYKKRTYLHFDPPVGPAHATKIASSPVGVARHAFYPLIRYSVTSKKIKRNPATGKLEIKSKSRPISYAAHLDSHIYAYYACNLGAIYESKLKAHGLENAVLAFRALDKCNIDFAKQAFDEIVGRGTCVAIALDVSKFFDKLDHQSLKTAWARLLDLERLPPDHYNVFRSVTQWAAVDKEALFQTLGISMNNPRHTHPRRLCDPIAFREVVRESGIIESNKDGYGIPQGTPISSVLSNIYMFEFDVAVHDATVAVNGAYMRYCDDILVIVPHGNDENIIKVIRENIAASQLQLNESKTCISGFTSQASGLIADRPLQYLGFTFDGQRILIRSAALARYSEKMKSGVRLAKKTAQKRNQTRAALGLEPRPLFKKEIYERYSHLGHRNFLRYGYRAAKIMKSQAIRKQLKPLWKRLRAEMEK